MRLFFYMILCTFTVFVWGQETNFTTPPSDRPVKVECDFYLLDLVSILDKEESFNADIYFSCAWVDPRLSYESSTPEDVKVYMDESAQDELKKIWWPQIEFLNAGQVSLTNSTLFIYPSGRVEYNMGLSGLFRSRLDLLLFPFDKQTLQVKVDSFLWNKNVVEFVPAEPALTVKNLEAPIHNDEKIVNIQISTEYNRGLKLKKFGDSNEFSTYVATITIERNPGFFLYQLFVPLFLVMGISCTVFFAYKSDYMQVIAICLTAFLVFLAAKFTVNLDLPRVGYMTVIDKAFLVGYITIGVSVVLCTLREIYFQRGKPWADKILLYGSWTIPLAFTLAILWIFFF